MIKAHGHDKVKAYTLLDVDVESLKSIVSVAGCSLVTSVVYWRSFASSSAEPDSVADACLWSGSFATTILIGHFAAVYASSLRAHKPATLMVLVHGKFVLQRHVGGAAGATTLVSSTPFLSAKHLPWAIYWWSYSVSDAMYSQITPFVVATEIWYLLGNLPDFLRPIHIGKPLA